MYRSMIQERSHVPFPQFNREQHYMVPFKKQDGLPRRLRHWQPSVDCMLRGIETDQTIYFMADQASVKGGDYHRRPGVHVDGYWRPDVMAHGGGHRGTHMPPYNPWRSHGGRHMAGGWENIDFSEPELLLLASDISGCRAFTGVYDETKIGDGGDASDVPLDGVSPVYMMDHRCYVGTVGTLHESLLMLRDCDRTVIRLNVPGVTLQ